MSYDAGQSGWGYPPAPAPNAGFQPPEGTNPGDIPPPPPASGWGQTPGPNQAPTPQGYAGQQPYYATYAGPMPAGTSGWAIASLVLSIASYVGLFFVGSVLGVIFGHIALNEIKNSNGRVEGRGMAIAGLVLGYVGLGLLLCAVAGFIALSLGALGSAPQ